jgi:hypothetical protein
VTRCTCTGRGAAPFADVAGSLQPASPGARAAVSRNVPTALAKDLCEGAPRVLGFAAHPRETNNGMTNSFAILCGWPASGRSAECYELTKFVFRQLSGAKSPS